jgi:hypothetical protein
MVRVFACRPFEVLAAPSVRRIVIEKLLPHVVVDADELEALSGPFHK